MHQNLLFYTLRISSSYLLIISTNENILSTLLYPFWLGFYDTKSIQSGLAWKKTVCYALWAGAGILLGLMVHTFQRIM